MHFDQQHALTQSITVMATKTLQVMYAFRSKGESSRQKFPPVPANGIMLRKSVLRTNDQEPIDQRGVMLTKPVE